MNFDNYLQQSWNDHATQAEKVASEFQHGALLVKTNEELDRLVRLVTHVMGEHLARWDEGLLLLSDLKNHSTFIKGSETENSILRSIAALQIGGGQNPELKSFSHSDQIRILTTAASALSEIDSEKAHNLLRQALGLAETGLEQKDPANRALAMTGNNLACSLEEKKSRTQEETAFMILASETGRKYWELAGGWLEVSRAEYRLTKTYLQAENLPEALRHAHACLELCRQNHAGNLDMFYAYEALAHAEKKTGNTLGFAAAVDQAKGYFEKLSDNEKPWCAPSLKKL